MPLSIDVRVRNMERVYYLRSGYRNTGIACFLIFLFFAVLSVFVTLTEVPKDRAIYAALLFGVFWGSWALAATWMLLNYWRGSLSIKDGQLCQRGPVGERKFELASVSEARWRPENHGRITLRTPSFRVTIDFDNFEPPEVLCLVRLFRSRLSESVQTNWPMFAYKVAVRLGDRMASEDRPPGPGEVLITRRRWDLYFIPAILLSGVVGIVASSILQQERLLIAPLGPTALWLMIRFMTPRQGLRASRIGSDPQRGFLYFLLVWACIGFAGIWAFPIANLPEPHATYLAVAGSIVWFAGLLLVGHRFDREKRRRDLESSELAMQQWEEREQPGAETALDSDSGEPTQ